MHLNAQHIQALPLGERIHLINSITGIKPANLIGTIDSQGQTNLAVFSSVVHLGSDPALIGFVLRPPGEVPRHTYENIQEVGCYTINHIHPSFAQQAHLTSAKFAKQQSEFEHCDLDAEFIADFKAPFVAASNIKYGLAFAEEILIARNNTRLIIGEIQHILLNTNPKTSDGGLDLELSQSVGISGLNSYYQFKRLDTFAQPKP
ncbi:flavin reductase family protein [Thiosulfativibrio zosterae]|uniref:Flavin oxidoreductase n=1 Tax=Thiosulfativibrio zosterae TaxID=2675053 RepID=A0A6F8PR26_9GAMM|nr:flavin reductase [Thiosulfativibrio zosterae]BBP44565.1 flavin oxidoreductase [Thiosulfativibrio zosterae]